MYIYLALILDLKKGKVTLVYNFMWFASQCEILYKNRYYIHD